ncbi:EKC/KEOPS complex subunit [Exophiala dermatitidis]
MVQQLHLAHTPANLALYVAVYRNVENVTFLREQLLAGNADFEYAFIDATLVVSTKHALAAAFRAINDYMNDRLKSRNIHSEIVFSLSPNNNIGEAFRRFGVTETTKDLLVMKVATTPQITLESVSQHLSTHIQGNEAPFDDATFQHTADFDRIRKVYKLSTLAPRTKKGRPIPKVDGTVNGDGALNNGDTVDFNETKNLEVQILGLMALRGAT